MQLSNGLVWRCQSTTHLLGKAEALHQPNITLVFAPGPPTADIHLLEDSITHFQTQTLPLELLHQHTQQTPSSLGMAGPTFLGGHLHPGGWQPAEPVLGDVHQSPG